MREAFLIAKERSTVIPPEEWPVIKEQAQMLASSNVVGSSLKQKPSDVMAIVMRGRELNLPPMTAISSIFIVDGKTSMSADLMKALVLRDIPESSLFTHESKEEYATIRAKRGSLTRDFTFTIEDAKRAGLTNKDNWKKYPKLMLVHRATAIAARDMFPDAIMGCYTPEEIEDFKDVTPPPNNTFKLPEYMPGLEPKRTVENFVEDIKKSKDADFLINDMCETYKKKGQPEWAERLMKEAIAKGLVEVRQGDVVEAPEVCSSSNQTDVGRS